MVEEPTAHKDNIWYSKAQTQDKIHDAQKRDFSRSVGFSDGISGVLYLLANAKLSGYNIDRCSASIECSLNFVKNRFENEHKSISNGLYAGLAGVSIAVSACLKAKLIEKSKYNVALITKCFETQENSLNLASGVAGIGLASLYAADYLNKSFLEELNKRYVSLLDNCIQPRGKWVTIEGKHKYSNLDTSFAYGNSGIIYYLLSAYLQMSFNDAGNLAKKGLSGIGISVNTLTKLLRENGYRWVLNEMPMADSLLGLVKLLLKAYEAFRLPIYRSYVELLLENIPETLVHENYSKDCGLSGLGEIYIESYRLFGDEKFLQKASWITELFIHTAATGHNESFYWLINNAEFPTADLMKGNGGILNFLIRYRNPKIRDQQFFI